MAATTIGRPVARSSAQLVADLSPLPAVLVVNYRYNVLTRNSGMAGMFVDFDTLPPSRRNAM
ncbi:hypothetical protein V5P93_004001 [Actinokineospora auranticolor]|uniref:MmyB-like transcription regulator ligand binding domain-containing protein n=1 Tax=Actinokineospora auranticolor TaxID=155976 RepID=A0A2S6GD07_9PSEU|nr:hypothetical protein [Actinokineospora auranticolor]PPK62746.1 hypothetical protein CLV40_13312 [Actinokineospora auranticolor]